MTNKVASLNNIFEQNTDNFAKQLTHLYNKWHLQRMPKESEWKEVRNYVFATDTTTTSNKVAPWAHTTTLPKLTTIRDMLHSAYMDALFPNDDWVIWEGDSRDDVHKNKRRTIEVYVKNKARHSGLREEISKCVYDYIDYGNCFGEVIWVDETHIDPVTQEEVTTYQGPRLNRISPYDITFNPTAAHFTKTPKFTRYLKGIGELKKELKYRKDLQYDEEAFKRAVDLRKTISAFQMEDINKSEGYAVDGFGTLSEYLGSGVMEIIEFEGDYYDEDNDILYENRLITIADRSFILRNIENPNWLGRDNKIHVGWRDRPDNLYAMGPLDNLVGIQYRIDHLENMKAAALDQTVLPPKKLIGGVDPFEWGPGAEIHVTEDQDVIPMPPNPAAFQVNNEIQYLMDLMEEMAGAPRQQMGIRTPGEKTAFEVQTLENNSARLFHSKTSKFEILFLEPILNLFLEAAKRNLDTTDVIRVMDDDVGVVEFMSITKEDITAKGKLRPIGARHFAARAQLVQNLNGIYNSGLGQLVLPHTSNWKLTQLLEETMGLNKFEIFGKNIAVAEQGETQKLIQEQQNTIQNEQSMPLEEDMGI